MSRFRALLQSSLNATKKALTWNVEDLMPPGERYIFNFNSKEELKKWHLYADSEYGGLSSASLEIADAGKGLTGAQIILQLTTRALTYLAFTDDLKALSTVPMATKPRRNLQLVPLSDIQKSFTRLTTDLKPPYPFVVCHGCRRRRRRRAVKGRCPDCFLFSRSEETIKPPGVFSGNLSLDVAEGSKWTIDRSGFCGMRSKKFDGFIDMEPYDTVALKLKGDGRCYISTIYTENWVNSPGQQEDNSWQAFVYVPKDNWYIAKIPLARYLPTWRGNVIDAEMEMNPSRILGMSLSVNAGAVFPGARSGPGDFKLEIDWIKALRTAH